MRTVPLLCSVRGCGGPLKESPQTYVCPRGHSFDVARSGYLNLLQPQDKRNETAAESVVGVEARERLFAKGVGSGLLMDLVALGSSLGEEPLVLEVVCGSGFLLTALGEDGCGVDHSFHALERAARRDPGHEWLAANADRYLPFPDSTFDLLFCSAGEPKNAAECSRVLSPEGHLIVVRPAPDDLIELRQAVFGKTETVEQAPVALAGFDPVRKDISRERMRLEPDLMRDLLTANGRAAPPDRLRRLERMEVTLSSEIFVLRPKMA